MVCPPPDTVELEKLFRYEVFKMLKSEGKIYDVDPLLCPKYLGSMRIIAFIEDQQIVKKILQHLDLWHV